MEKTDPQTTKPEDSVENESIETAPENTDASQAEPSREPDPITPEDLKALKEKAAKSDEYYDRFLRLTAEFDNFKKRAARERLEAVKYANEALIEQLLPTLDHFDMALVATQNQESLSLESITTGIKMVYNQFKNVLSDSGLEEVEATGKVFDPTIHEAVSEKECKDTPEGQVLQQLRKGYRLKERLIRPATVVVAKRPCEDESKAVDPSKEEESQA